MSHFCILLEEASVGEDLMTGGDMVSEDWNYVQLSSPRHPAVSEQDPSAEAVATTLQ